MATQVDTHSNVPGPPYCTYGLRVPASCVRYVPEAQGSLPRAATAVRTPHTYRPRACRTCRTYRAPWHAPGGHSFYLANRDFRTLRTACRVIAFHDVVNAAVGWDAVPRLWKSLTDPGHNMYAHEFAARNCTMQPKGGSGSYMGIGVLTRRAT